MYLPSFLEIFLGLAGVALWSMWGRSHAPAPQVWVALPWVVGGAVVLGQIVAGYAMFVAGTPGSGAGALIDQARIGSGLAVVAGATVALGLTVAAGVRRVTRQA